MEIRGFGGGSGSGGVSTITDGTTTVTSATEITIVGGTVTNSGGGNATITFTGGGGGSPGTPVNSVQFNNPLGTFAGDANFTYTTGAGLAISNSIIQNAAYAKFGNASPFLAVTTGMETWGNDNTTSGVQIGIGNRNSGVSAYGFIFMNNDLAVSADNTHYAGLGYNSSGYTDTTFGTGVAIANQFQLWNTDGPITFIASKATAQYVNILIGGSATTNEIGRFGVITNLTLNKSALGVTTADSLLLNNTTAAAAAAQQISPSLHFQSFGWGTTAGTSQSVDWRINSLPVQSTTPSANLLMQFALNGGAYTTEYTFASNGGFVANGSVSGNGGLNTQSGAPGGANLFVNAGSNMVGASGAQLLFGGASSIYIRADFGGTSTGTPANAANGANVVFGSTPYTIANAQNSPLLTNVVINPIGTVILTGSGTVTNTASLYIQGASAGTVTGANYALYINSGNSLMNGNLTLGTAGNGLSIKEGTNARMGTGTLSGGTVVISTTAVTANSRIFLTDEGGTVTNLGSLYISARTAGASFTVSSTNVLDASTFAWIIFEPAP